MEPIIDILNQKNTEEQLNIKQLNSILNECITEEMVELGVKQVNKWLEEEATYDSKRKRKEYIKTLKLDILVRKVILATMMSQEQEIIAPVVSRILSYINTDPNRDSLIMVGELLAVVSETDFYDIGLSSTGRLMILSRLKFSKELTEWINKCHYLPPMTVAPKIIANNFESGYLTFDDCVILKSYNQHCEFVSLDVINTLNQTPLAIAYGFISKFEEFPNKEPKTFEALEQWELFKKQSYKTYQQTLKETNKIYFTHKVDKRGRIYCMGYHLSYQGTGYKKASIEFYEKQAVEVPIEYQL